MHAKEEEAIARLDRQFILNLLNYEMTDIFASLGIDTRGGEFVYVYPSTTTPEEKVHNLRTCILDFGLPVDPDYVYKPLGVEKPADFKDEDWQFQRTLVQQHTADPDDDPDGDAEESSPSSKDNAQRPPRRQPQNRLRGFFAQAPRRNGAFEW